MRVRVAAIPFTKADKRTLWRAEDSSIGQRRFRAISNRPKADAEGLARSPVERPVHIPARRDLEARNDVNALGPKVVEGTARVTIDGEVRLITENQSVYVPLGAVHRLENPGKLPMILIEVQTGAYLGEDDIIRYDDVYARGQGAKG